MHLTFLPCRLLMLGMPACISLLQHLAAKSARHWKDTSERHVDL